MGTQIITIIRCNQHPATNIYILHCNCFYFQMPQNIDLLFKWKQSKALPAKVSRKELTQKDK